MVYREAFDTAGKLDWLISITIDDNQILDMSIG